MFNDKKEAPIFSVSEYVGFINDLTAVVPVLVEGEVSNFRDIAGRNFCYFDIKDRNAVAKCFQGFWRSKKTALENGTTVRVFGYPTLQKNGSLVIDVGEVLLVGDGDLNRQYQELKTRLEEEGLFAESLKKELPRFPISVGLIAGKSSSAYHDVIAEISERWSETKIVFYPSKVQGIGAKQEIVRAIKRFNQENLVDILIIARGGGSMEDLQAFDSEEVVREIFASKIPTVSAIGHEDHWTLSDFVSDMRAKTPTKAAQIAVPSKEEMLEQLDFCSLRLRGCVKNELGEALARLNIFNENLSGYTRAQLMEMKRDISLQKQSLVTSLGSGIEKKKHELETSRRILIAMNPENILRKGYVVVQKNGIRVINIEEVRKGDEISVRLHNGEIIAKILNSREFKGYQNGK